MLEYNQLWRDSHFEHAAQLVSVQLAVLYPHWVPEEAPEKQVIRPVRDQQRVIVFVETTAVNGLCCGLQKHTRKTSQHTKKNQENQSNMKKNWCEQNSQAYDNMTLCKNQTTCRFEIYSFLLSDFGSWYLITTETLRCFISY